MQTEWHDSCSFSLRVLSIEGTPMRTSAARAPMIELPLDAEEPELREIISTEISPVVMIAVTDVGGVGELAIRDVAREAASRLRERFAS